MVAAGGTDRVSGCVMSLVSSVQDRDQPEEVPYVFIQQRRTRFKLAGALQAVDSDRHPGTVYVCQLVFCSDIFSFDLRSR